MSPWILVLGTAVLGAGALLALSAARFSRRISSFEDALRTEPLAEARRDLPAPVEAFARRGMAGSDALAGYVELEQTVEMRLKRGGDWSPMTARQVIGAATTGFVWTARMALGPLTVVRVVDAFVDGRGLLEVRALGAIPMGREQGPEADRGEAMRYLAELPWSPDAILGNRAIRWRLLDDGRAAAALDLDDGPAEVVFRFDELGDVIEMTADGRPAKDEQGRPVEMAWRGRMWDYGDIGGRRVPCQGEVGWVWPEGYEAYWRGRFTSYRPGLHDGDVAAT